MLPNIKSRSAGFSVLELLMAIVVLGIISTFAISKYGDVKEQAYIDTMMNDLRNFALLQGQVHSDEGTFVAVDSLQARGFHFSTDVYADSADIGTDSFFMKVGHAKTDRYCELDYDRNLTGSAQNKIQCPGDAAGEGSATEDQQPVAFFEVTDSSAGGAWPRKLSFQ